MNSYDFAPSRQSQNILQINLGGVRRVAPMPDKSKKCTICVAVVLVVTFMTVLVMVFVVHQIYLEQFDFLYNYSPRSAGPV